MDILKQHMRNYIDADKLLADIKQKISICEKQRSDAIEVECYNLADHASARIGELHVIQETIVSLQQEQPEVDYNIIPLSEERMARYIAYCLGREDDDCNCPTCGKHVTGLRLFPYYYDRKDNDVYFASICPECGKIIISKE